MSAKNGVADPAPRKKCPKPDERLPIIIRGIEEGKSIRGIARELGCDDKTIARDLRKLTLPPEQFAAIQEGDSAEKYLNAALLEQTGIDWSARNKLRRRDRDDKKEGKYSDPLSRALLGWLSTKRLTDWNTKLVLNDAKRISGPLPDTQPPVGKETFGAVVEPVERNPNLDLRIESPEPEFMNRCAWGLVIGLLRVEPLQVIRESALAKALESVRARGHWTDKLGSPFAREGMLKRRNLRGGK